ncbi:site-2 protease family protein [Nocardia aurantiaca]|uniref:Zinc metalloprotease n=1 Tax=Nocardia aurantiaca TaxID=2675850 RepID=A0A6I3KTZ7_9NOCA|nr:site-2 protease family protein [Nocardia aurantiaca]MTE14283.1 CBS domain-containing protein [Nocardia aurantiaca]
MQLQSTLPLGRIAGIRIAAHWSAAVTVGLFTWILATYLRGTADAGIIWAAATIGALALIACLLAHELAHSIVATRNGIHVERIVLWLLGGASELAGEPKDARTDLRVALVGPATSLLLGAIGFGAAAVSSVFSPGGPVTATLVWLATVNVILAVFNMLPGAPLDGGRVVRAVIWWRSGDRLRAETAAARWGQVLGMTLAGIGAAEIIAFGNFGGLWLILLGWFLYGAANSELILAGLRHRLGASTVGDVMTPAPRAVPATWTVDQLLHSDLVYTHHRVFPVIDHNGHPCAILAWADLLRPRTPAHPGLRVAELARPLPPAAIAHVDDLLGDVIARIVLRPNLDAVVVVDPTGRLAGLVTSTDLTLVCNRSALGLPVHPTVTPS